MSKKVRGANVQHSKRTVCENVSTDGEQIVFDFGNVDHGGRFCFDPHKDGFDAVTVLTELIGISGQTWAQLKQATHNNGKSKHHFLNEDSLSAEAKSRKFIVKWYDQEHEFSKPHR